MIRTLALPLALLASACTGISAPAARSTADISPARFDRFVAPSVLIEASGITVWLPPGYDGSRRRYGVVYMHDGQNLFDPAKAGFGKVWAADKAVEALVAAHRIDPVIIVGIDHHGAGRYRHYVPQSVYGAMPQPVRDATADWVRGGVVTDDYVTFLVGELKPAIDARYRTRTDAAHTAIVGSSMGGLVSCYAIVEHARVFGGAACVSTHWPMMSPVADTGDTIPYRSEVLKVWREFFRLRLGPPDGRRVWMDHGTATLDRFYAPYQEAINHDFERAGWKRGVDFASRVYPGAEHDERAWAQRLPDMLDFILPDPE